MIQGVKFEFEIHMINGDILTPKGFYHKDKKNLIICGCVKSNHNIRLKVAVSDVKNIIIKNN